MVIQEVVGRFVGGTHHLSGIWKGVLSVEVFFFQSIHYHVGKANRVLFWLDTWIGESPLATQFPELFRCAQNGNALVSDYVE